MSEFGGLSCTADRGCPAPYACVQSVCKRKLDTFSCETDLDCPIGLLCDPAQSFCRQCLSDEDCPGGRCYSASHCVQCTEHADCPSQQRCDGETLRCAPCTTPCADIGEPRVGGRRAR